MDEDTRALLDFLEAQSSGSNGLRKNFMLRDKEKYFRWMKKMEGTLNSENMRGFVDGSLRDPDPKGEIEDERLRLYSEKWKKLDNQVMEWIRDSLDDTLKEVVEEFKTSEDIWDMLRTYFDTDGIASYAKQHVRIKLLNQKHYREWMLKMEEFLQANGMLGYVNGEEEHPDPRGGSEDEDMLLRSDQKWKRADKHVMNWIMASINDIFNYMVREMKTSKEMWDKLVTFFTEDIGAMLDSLEDSHSDGKGVMKIFNIKLLDKESCQPWRNEMIKFLYSQSMIGFIVGTLRDLDPKGESGDEHVRMYSAKWKRLDKQVMKWIMASLSDILKYMVEGIETAKELWDTLVTFFATEGLGPLDSNSTLSMLMNETTYIEWKKHTESFLVDKKLGGFIDGTFRNLSEYYGSIRQKDKAIVKIHSERWTVLDQRVMTLIKSLLSVTVLDVVKDLKSSKEFWHALEILFNPVVGYPLPITVPVNEASFLSIKLSGKENYLQWSQQIKCLLEFHGLQNLIDPLSRPPPATFGIHAKWKKYNQLLKGWIFSSLAQNVIDKTLTRIPTATGLWGEIKNRYERPDFEKTDSKGEYNHGNYTDLYKAIMSGDFNKTRDELDKHGGHDIELNEDGNTALHIVINTRDTDHEYFQQVLTLVLEKINASTTDTLNNCGSSSNSTNQSSKLVNLVNRHGKNTLHRAALVGNLNAAEMLVVRDPYLLFKEDNDECLPILAAISTPHKDTFRFLLISSKEHLYILGNEEITKTFGLINPFKGKHGVRLLNAAIEAGYMEVAYELIKMDPNIATEIDGNRLRTPLHKIVENYDKYYSLPTSWRIFDQDAGKKFKNTKIVAVPAPENEGTQTGETPPPNQGEMPNVEPVDQNSNNVVVTAPESKGTQTVAVPTPENGGTQTGEASPPNQGEMPNVEPVAQNSDNGETSLPIPRGTINVDTGDSSFSWFPKTWFSKREPPVPAIAEPDRNTLLENEVRHNKTLLVLRSICNQLRSRSTILEKREHYYFAAIMAARKDQHEALKEIVEHFPEAMWVKDGGYNLLQVAIKYRSEKVFNFLAYETKVNTYFLKVRKTHGNNLLHLAGGLTAIEKLDKDAGAALQMRKEVKWFKKVEKFALPGCDNEKNNTDETPMMVFRKEHADLKKRGEEWMKTVANSYIIVAALIVTITFAALITVPGGSQQDSGDSPVGSPVGSPVVNRNNVGLPVFIENNLFMVFVFSNVTSFCGATSALVMFLSILTSRYTEEDFINKLPWKLAIGLLALIVSLVGMLVAFGATLLLMLGDKDTFILVGIAFGIGLPIVTFIGFQVRMLWKIFR